MELSLNKWLNWEEININGCIESQLNQWDRKYIEEPAYETRLEGFAEAKDMFPALQDEGQWSPDLLNSLLPVLHNALYTLSQVQC